MFPRVYLPDVNRETEEVRLPDDEAHHLGRVLRVGPGAEVRVFDGRGREYRAHVTTASRQDVRVRVSEPVAAQPLPHVSLTVVQALLKGNAMDDIVRDCTMVGVTALQPVRSERCTVSAASLSRARERWQRVAVASAKQCGRAALPVIAEPTPFPLWLDRHRTGLALLLVEPAAAAGALRLRDLARQAVPERASIVVGPEGGWTPEEHEAARAAGCQALTLGPLTLRAAAVPLVAAAALLALWE
jgi:16S rRNA (uracil1498-N3)-methyltransferase